MTDNVKPLRKVAEAPELGDDAKELAAVIRGLLDEVLSGEVTGFVGIVVTKDDDYLPNIAGAYHADAMIGSLWRLQRIIDDAEADAEQDEDED